MSVHSLKHARYDKPLRLSVILPAYNEEMNIRAAVDTITAGLRSLAIEYELIVVDDGSTDSTGDIIRHLAEQDNRIKVHQHEMNAGKGTALASGFKLAGMEWILFTDADLQIDISELAAFLQCLGGCCAVIGYRQDRKDSPVRKILSKAFGLLVRFALGVRARDVNCPFKLFRREVLDGFVPRSRGFLIDAELLDRINALGCMVRELPVACHMRRKGKSAVRFRHFNETLRELLMLVLHKHRGRDAGTRT